MLHIYMLTLLGVALGQMAPGPNLFAVASAALGQGWRTAMWMTSGIATAIFLWITLATFGLATVLEFYPGLLTFMKFAGGSYFIILSLKALGSARQRKNHYIANSYISWSPLYAWKRGLVVNLSNPKSALMWGAITTFMFGAGLSKFQVLGFAPVGYASAMLIYGTYAFFFSRNVVRGLYSKFAYVFEAMFGAVFGLAGAGLIVSGIRDVVGRVRLS